MELLKNNKIKIEGPQSSDTLCSVFSQKEKGIILSTQYVHDVILTSIRRRPNVMDVVQMLKQRCVPVYSKEPMIIDIDVCEHNINPKLSKNCRLTE